MKTAALGNALPMQPGNGAPGRRYHAGGDSFTEMLQAIFAARGPGAGMAGDSIPSTGRPQQDGSAAKEPQPDLSKLHGNAAGSLPDSGDSARELKDGTHAPPPRPHGEKGMAAARNEGAAAAFSVSPLQQWEELPAAGQQLARLILAAVLEKNGGLNGHNGSVVEGLQAENGFNAGENSLAAIMENFLPPGQQLLTIRQQFAKELTQELKAALVTDGALPFKNLVQEIMGGLLPQPLEKELPLPTPSQLSLAALRQGLPALLGEHLAKMEMTGEGTAETGEKPHAWQNLLGRVEKFLHSLLSGDGEKTNNPAGLQPDGLGSRQLGEQLPLAEAPPQETNAGAKFSSILLDRSEGNAAGRGINAHTPSSQAQQIMAQVMERVALLARPGIQELRLQLQPAYLGNMLIRLRNVQGVLTAEVLTQHMAVKELLESQLDSLRQRFLDMNLAVEEFHVFVGGDESQGRSFGTPESQGINFYGRKAEAQETVSVQTVPGDGKEHLVNFLV